MAPSEPITISVFAVFGAVAIHVGWFGHHETDPYTWPAALITPLPPPKRFIRGATSPRPLQMPSTYG